MLLRFRASNFRSFRAEQELSMIAGAFSDRAETVRHPPGSDEGVLPVAAIYGANASGKTNVVLAIRFMSEAVRNSHARWEPDEPIRLEPFAGQSDSPSTFSVDFLLDGVRYQYGFSLSPEAVLEEWVNAYPLGKKQTWFSREKGKPISFSAKLQGDNKTIERLTRPNSLFLSAAAQNNHEALSLLYGWFSRSLSFVIGERSTTRPRARALYRDADLRNKLAQLVSLADLGITDLSVREVEMSEKVKEAYARLASPSRQRTKTGKPRPFDDWPREVQFLHRIGDSTLPFREAQESKGTIAFLCLLDPVSRALAKGGVVCVDELDDSLHPLLAIEVIRQFSDAGSNPTGAQLIFNTHDTNLLSAGVLRRDQIWFTEKRPDGASQLYPLTDFKPRMHENLESGYLQGRYGAIPFLNPGSFFTSTHEKQR
ncbi:MAG: AAA family ATPase [Bryobacteraceae bacterium]